MMIVKSNCFCSSPILWEPLASPPLLAIRQKKIESPENFDGNFDGNIKEDEDAVEKNEEQMQKMMESWWGFW